MKPRLYIDDSFIPPKDDDVDYNPEIDRMIEEEIERANNHSSDNWELEDYDDPNDLKDVL